MHEVETSYTITKSHGSFHLIGKGLVGDLGAAAIAATFVAPPVAVIDRAVVEQITRGQPLFKGLRIHGAALRQPLRLLLSRPGGIVWTLYAATYAVANTSDTTTTRLLQVQPGAVTFVATMMVNVPLGVWKDIRFAQMYGFSMEALKTQSKSKAVPVAPVRSSVSLAATATFLFRDGLTIFSSFILAPYMAVMIPDRIMTGTHTKAVVTQIMAPILSQLVATPAHLLGLSLQSWPYRIGARQRLKDIWRDLPVTTLVRCIRIIPAFSLGCLFNSELRSVCYGSAAEYEDRSISV